MSANLGIDVSAIIDIDPMFRTVSGALGVGQASARRLITSRGRLVGDLDYGYDLRSFLGEAILARTAFQVQTAVEAEVLKDERAESVDVTVTIGFQTRSMIVEVKGETAEGPFELVLKIDDVTVEVLKVI